MNTMALGVPLFISVFWMGSTSLMNLGMSLGMSPLPSALVAVLGTALTVLLIGGA